MDIRPVAKTASLRFAAGERVGRLTIVRAAYAKQFKRGVAVVFLCRCDCGAEIERDRQSLIKPRDHSCGPCGRSARGTAPPGASKRPLYKTWWHMIDRCENPKTKSFADYGARGIKVCDRWVLGADGLTGFECFLADMPAKLDSSLMIERINNAAGYEPGNCTWADRTTQNRNKRNSKKLEVNGRTMTPLEWSAETGVPYFTILQRLSLGWSATRAVTPGDGRRRAR